MPKMFIKKLVMPALMVGLILILAAPISAQDKYISYETLYGVKPASAIEGNKTALSKALELARYLDKGTYQKQLIRTTGVMNYSDSDFFIIATLANGQTVRFYVDLLKSATENRQLLLRDSLQLVFPDENMADFVVFDLKTFYNQLLYAQFFKQQYPLSHPFENKEFYYQIKSVKVQDSQPKIYYHIELLNGIDLRYSVNQVYGLLKNNRLLADINNQITSAFGLYSDISKVSGIPGLQIENLDLRNIKSDKNFGIQLTFYEPPQFRVEDVEVIFSKQNQNFYLDIVIPNVKRSPSYISENLTNLEYIRLVRLVEEPKQGFSRLRFEFFNRNFDAVEFVKNSPKLMFSPDKKNFFIIFSQDINQTVSYANYDEALNRVDANNRYIENQLKLLDYNQDGDKFILTYNQAANHYNESLKITDWQSWIGEFKKSMQYFTLAGGYAGNDKEFKLAVDGRNAAIDRVFNGILLGNVYPLIKIEKFSRDKQIIDEINDLTKYALSNRAKNIFVENLKSLYFIDKKTDMLNLAIKNKVPTAINANDLKEFNKILSSQKKKIAALSFNDPNISDVKERLIQNLNSLDQILNSK